MSNIQKDRSRRKIGGSQLQIVGSRVSAVNGFTALNGQGLKRTWVQTGQEFNHTDHQAHPFQLCHEQGGQLTSTRAVLNKQRIGARESWGSKNRAMAKTSDADAIGCRGMSHTELAVLRKRLLLADRWQRQIFETQILHVFADADGHQTQ
jgi:hypothetical protein